MQLEDGPRLISRGATLYAVGYGYLAMTVCLLGNDAVHWLVGDEFAAGSAVIPTLTLAAYAASLCPFLRVGLHQAKKPLLLSAIEGGGAVANVALNFMLIPPYGFQGAAVATLLAQLVSTLVSWPVSQRLYFIPFEYRRLSLAAAILVGSYLVGMAFDPLGWLAASVCQTLVVVCVPLLLYVSGFFKPEELNLVRTGWRFVANLVHGA
jgi:O-antigen/teichoic acid export membrane protein